MEGKDREKRVKRYQNTIYKIIGNKDMLYSTEKYSHYFIVTKYGVQSIKPLNHCVVYLTLT